MMEKSTQPYSRETWFRLIFVLLFVAFYGITEIILAVVIVIQFGFVLITGKRNPGLLEFGAGLSKYNYQILLFATFNMENKPFPFTPWPVADAPTTQSEYPSAAATTPPAHQPSAASPATKSEPPSTAKTTQPARQTGAASPATKSK